MIAGQELTATHISCPPPYVIWPYHFSRRSICGRMLERNIRITR